METERTPVHGLASRADAGVPHQWRSLRRCFQGTRRLRLRIVSHQRISASSRSPRLSPIVRPLGGGDKRLRRCRRVATRSVDGLAAAPALPRNGAREVKRLCQAPAERPREVRAEPREGAAARERLESSRHGSLTTM